MGPRHLSGAPRVPLLALGTVLLAAGPTVSQNPRLLRDIHPGPRSSLQYGFAPASVGRTSLFRADDGTTGLEPWLTDGTTAGTRLVRDVSPGPPGGMSWASAAGGNLFFINLADLWATDGTPAGTRLVQRLSGIQAGHLPAFGDRVVFLADDGVRGVEPWISDGTPGGTTILADAVPGSGSSFPASFTRVGDCMFFVATDAGGSTRLWMTDGTPGGTAPLPGVPAADHSDWTMAAVGERLFFVMRTAATGTLDLWVSDGTPRGSRTVVGYGPTGGGPELVPLGDRVVFDHDDGQRGAELWISDGTAAGTRIIVDLNPGPGSSRPALVTPFDDEVLFYADDGRSGAEPWISDGTGPGTHLLRDIVPGTAPTGLHPFQSVADDRAYFSRLELRAPGGVELWETDGTTRGTWKVLDGVATPHIHHGRMFFAGTATASGTEPWVFEPGALAHPVGFGCGAGMRASRLSSTTPELGAPWRLRGTLAPVGGLGVVVLGAVADPPLALQGTCVSYVDLSSSALLSQFASISSTWSSTWTLPSIPALRGLTLAAQTWYGPSANPNGFELSNAVYLTLGN